MQPDSTLLFRYSALTFNGHKIHYDFPYATQVEGYHGLVIHGPLLATYMINCFVKNHPDKQIINYSYRGMHAFVFLIVLLWSQKLLTTILLKYG